MGNPQQDVSTEMWINPNELVRVGIHCEITPDGPLTTFSISENEDRKIIAVHGELLRSLEFTDYFLPWKLQRIGHNAANDIVYFKRID